VKPRLLPLLAVCALVSLPAQAGNQKEERLAASVRTALHEAVSDAPPTIAIEDADERDRWLSEMSQRLEKRIPDQKFRKELLTTIHYEAIRAGLDPQLVLGLIQVESRFKRYALSKAGARGYMQVMPFWVEAIGNREDNLFHMRTNLRYGCTILRHYIDIEKGSLFLALGRYNGSRGQAEYPNRVLAAWQKQWAWTPSQTPVKVAVEPTKAVEPVSPAPAAPTPAPPPAALPPVAAATLPPAPDPPQAEPPRTPSPPSPGQTASRMPARRDIVIVR
jgi:soluble lytic murein transglycosylase-like protein